MKNPLSYSQASGPFGERGGRDASGDDRGAGFGQRESFEIQCFGHVLRWYSLGAHDGAGEKQILRSAQGDNSSIASG